MSDPASANVENTQKPASRGFMDAFYKLSRSASKAQPDAKPAADDTTREIAASTEAEDGQHGEDDAPAEEKPKTKNKYADPRGLCPTPSRAL